MSTDTPSASMHALEFKSSSLSLPVLLLASTDLAAIGEQLADKVAQAPEFFRHSPLVIDLQKINPQPISLTDLVKLLRQHDFLPVGIRGGNAAHQAEALALQLPSLSAHGQNSPLEKPVPAKPASETAAPAVSGIENKLITQPIRSGQRVYAKGDLIVTATVSAGAEIMAEGNIHIYGALRGRALAGVLGNTDSRIFCSDMQAELISIAGIYQLRDDLAAHPAHQPIQIYLDNQTLIIKPC